VLVTPGMIELGPVEIEANRRFGRQAASGVRPCRAGRRQADRADPAGIAGTRILIGFKLDLPTLKDGLGPLARWLQPGDTMLLENDLPDQYAGM